MVRSASLIQRSATGEEIEAIIAERLIPAVAGLEDYKILLSLLTFFIALSKPDVTPDELRDTVKGASQYICLALSEDQTGIDTDKIEKNKLN